MSSLEKFESGIRREGEYIIESPELDAGQRGTQSRTAAAERSEFNERVETIARLENRAEQEEALAQMMAGYVETVTIKE